MRIEEVLTAPHRPWQNPFAERLIGSIRRECLTDGRPIEPPEFGALIRIPEVGGLHHRYVRRAA
jgi:hypothetical protein